MKILYIVRGLPGSGKSTLAKSLTENHYEADMFFMKDGVYNFEPTKIKAAHSWCQDSVRSLMENEVGKIAVSNTFTQEWEMKPYFDMASEFGYTVFSLIIENRHDGVNIHNVPIEVINKMKTRFEIKI